VIDVDRVREMTGRNLISVIFISVHLALILVLLYVFIPLLPQMLWVVLNDGSLLHGPETNGIGVVVVGGISEWVAWQYRRYYLRSSSCYCGSGAGVVD
jgi:hypothetical protein